MRLAAFFLTLTLASSLPAPQPETPPAPETPRPTGGPGNGPRGGASSEPEIKPYDRVITKNAKTLEGLFKVHQIRSKVFYEIPVSELGRDMLMVSRLAQTTLGAGYGGARVSEDVIRWERRGDRVLLRLVSYDIVADPKHPMARAVEASNTPGVLLAFPIEALGKGDAPVIDVTRLFTTEIPEFSPRQNLRARGFDSARSFIESVKAFPENINVAVLQTFTAPPDSGMGGRGESPAPTRPGAGAMRGSTGTVLMHYSMVKLPEKRMRPRLKDDRVGYFSIRQRDYGTEEHRASEREYIARWRLEKKDPSAALSEPVKPIVYYIDPATPKQWVPFIKKGIEDWQPAFEAAGFKKAIVAKDAPTAEQDPNWSPEDARVSCVRWLPSTVKNAQGPHVSDPRTGEILESDILMYHNILELQRDWYFSQAGAVDPRAKKLPLPDDLMGELVRYVVAHEVGHTLGLPHNMKASSLYPFEKLRDREWLAKMGHTPTIMDYSRFNYVVQPEDNIAPELLIPRIGPYDLFAIAWGYKPIPNASSPEAEKSTLEEWIKPQDTTPWLRFSTTKSMGADPGELTEAVGDADAVAATTLGTKNIQRVMGMLLTAVPQKGETYDDLGAVYDSVIGQWSRELGHVAALVGSFHSQQKHGGQEGVLFQPVPRERQKAAVKFLNANLFTTPKWLVPREVERRLEPAGAMQRLLNVQRNLLSNLLGAARMNWLMEQEATGATPYRATEFLADLREGVFTELAQPTVMVDPWRRNLQRVYLETVNTRLNGRPAAAMFVAGGTRFAPVVTNPDDDSRGLLRAELRTLAAQISRTSTADRATRAHLDDLKDRIGQILDPKLPSPSPASGGLFGRPTIEDEMSCWPDLRP